MADESNNHDIDHADALARTGFGGARGAGAIIKARSTGRILLAHRSSELQQPGTWGSWGGAIDREEDAIAAVRREIQEETGYAGEIVTTVPLFVFKSESFTYENFLVVIPNEFIPALNWESQGAKWFDAGRWPEPLHFGLVRLFSAPLSLDALTSTMERHE